MSMEEREREREEKRERQLFGRKRRRRKRGRERETRAPSNKPREPPPPPPLPLQFGPVRQREKPLCLSQNFIWQIVFGQKIITIKCWKLCFFCGLFRATLDERIFLGGRVFGSSFLLLGVRIIASRNFLPLKTTGGKKKKRSFLRQKKVVWKKKIWNKRGLNLVKKKSRKQRIFPGKK